MNVKGPAITAAAAFVAVLCALQFDHFVHRPATNSNPDQTVMLMQSAPDATIKDAAYAQDQSGTLDFRAAAKKVIPSVVSVDRYEQVTDFFGDPTNQITETGTGSGVIIDGAKGYIVTNNHVVADENGNVVPQVKVRLYGDKKTYVAKVVGNDPRADLAVIKINGTNLPSIDVGSSGDLQVGQWVMAVGNPLGFDDTVSVGVVSSLKRDLPLRQGTGLVNAIQTDAAINPGNSGGALCDQHGRLIGINSAIASGNGGSVGIGFAIPVDRVKSVVNDIVHYGYARYASLGVNFYTNAEGVLGDPRYRDLIAERTGTDDNAVPSSGIIVANSAGPSANAGIHQLDIIEALDGQPVDTYFDMNRILMEKKPGEKISVKWWSKGQTKTATVTLQESGGPTQ